MRVQSPHFEFALSLQITMWLIGAGCRLAPVVTREWSASASLALAASSVPADGGIPLPFNIKSVATPSGGIVMLWPSGDGVESSSVCSQVVCFAEEALHRTAKWTGRIGDAGRVASECEARAIVEAFVWLQMRGISETEYEVDASTDAKGNVSVLLQSVPYHFGGHYLFWRMGNGLRLGP